EETDLLQEEMHFQSRSDLTGEAGTPATTTPGSTSRGTTAPAPTIAPSPILTPGRMTAPVPIQPFAPISPGFETSLSENLLAPVFWVSEVIATELATSADPPTVPPLWA